MCKLFGNYLGLSKFCLGSAFVVLFSNFCVGLDFVSSIIGCSLMFLSAGFFMVQGKYKAGYLFSAILAIVSVAQYMYHLPNVYWIISGSISAVFVVLQTIEFLFKDKPLFPCKND